ncbi:MAG: hypothetical protein ACP5HU_08420 [Phycisphaerae bacterium]
MLKREENLKWTAAGLLTALLMTTAASAALEPRNDQMQATEARGELAQGRPLAVSPWTGGGQVGGYDGFSGGWGNPFGGTDDPFGGAGGGLGNPLGGLGNGSGTMGGWTGPFGGIGGFGEGPGGIGNPFGGLDDPFGGYGGPGDGMGGLGGVFGGMGGGPGGPLGGVFGGGEGLNETFGGMGGPFGGGDGGPGPFTDKAFGGGALCSGGCGYNVDFCMPAEVIHRSCPGGWQGQDSQDAGYYRSLAHRAFYNASVAEGDASDMWYNIGFAYGAEAFDAEKGCGGGHIRSENLGGGWVSIMVGDSSYLYNENTGACIHYDDHQNGTNDQQNGSSTGEPQAQNEEQDEDESDADGNDEEGDHSDSDDESGNGTAACEGPEGNGGGQRGPVNPQDVNWDEVTGGVVSRPTGPDGDGDDRGNNGAQAAGGWRKPGTECTDPAEMMLPAFDGCAVKPLPAELVTDPLPIARTADSSQPGATVAALQGLAQKMVVENGQARWADLRAGETLAAGTIVRTGLGGRVELRFADGAEASVAPATKMGIAPAGAEGQTGHVHLKYGSLAFQGADQHGVCVTTPAGSVRLMQANGTVSYQHGAGLRTVGGANAWQQTKVGGGPAMQPAVASPQPMAAGALNGPRLGGAQGIIIIDHAGSIPAQTTPRPMEAMTLRTAR